MIALPFIFLTDDFHVISSAALQSAQAPAQIPAKTFYKPHVEDIKTEFFKVQSMGSGTAEEWLKGLDAKGKERRNDSLRWERWELTGGVRRMQSSDRTWFQDPALYSNPAITNSSTASNETGRPLPGNVVSQIQGGGDGSTQDSGHSTQPEPINAPFCKISIHGTIIRIA